MESALDWPRRSVDSCQSWLDARRRPLDAGRCRALMRYSVAGWAQRLSSGTFPVGTLLVSVVGYLDADEKSETLLPYSDQMVEEGRVTMEEDRVWRAVSGCTMNRIATT